MQESELRGHDVPNAGEILEQFGGTNSRADGAAGHGEKEDRAITEPHAAEVRARAAQSLNSIFIFHIHAKE